MKLVLAVATTAVLLCTGVAYAERESEDRFMKDMKETVYATNHHMGFSLRAAIIDWLGGVPIVDERDLRASQRERWWGNTVPVLPPEVINTPDR